MKRKIETVWKWTNNFMNKRRSRNSMKNRNIEWNSSEMYQFTGTYRAYFGTWILHSPRLANARFWIHIQHSWVRWAGGGQSDEDLSHRWVDSAGDAGAQGVGCFCVCMYKRRSQRKSQWLFLQEIFIGLI